MSTTATKAYKEVSQYKSFTADEMEKMRKETTLAELVGAIAIVAFCLGFFIGIVIRGTWV